MKTHWIRKQKEELKFVRRTTVLLEERGLINDNGGLEELLQRTHKELQAAIAEAIEVAHRTGWQLCQMRVDLPGLLDSYTWSGYVGGNGPGHAAHFFLDDYTIEKLRTWFHQCEHSPGCTFQIKRLDNQRWHIVFAERHRKKTTSHVTPTATAAP